MELDFHSYGKMGEIGLVRPHRLDETDFIVSLFFLNKYIVRSVLLCFVEHRSGFVFHD